jgi:hypothetical protein
MTNLTQTELELLKAIVEIHQNPSEYENNLHIWFTRNPLSETVLDENNMNKKVVARIRKINLKSDYELLLVLETLIELNLVRVLETVLNVRFFDVRPTHNGLHYIVS